MTRVGPDWPAGLPVPLTRLVGRERELADVTRLVAAGRLVTLTGAGGVGKTRLAVEVAAAVASDFGDGVVWADLSAVADAALVAGAVAQELGVEERGGEGVEGRLVRVLSGQRRLLVLDNCEHLRAGCAGLVTAVLGSCPEVVVLATSRERLGVAGEVCWRVPSLTFPWPEGPPAAEDLEGFAAVALFAERARAASPELRIGAAELPAVRSICFRLDGIPLALELAAARAGALSLAEIASRLAGRFGLLAGSGAGPARHQTLRASVEWSYQLLSQAERVLFARLGVFAGGWSLEAAETVCSAPPLAPEQVTALLAALVDKSLVQVEVTGAAGRYRLLEVIRAFAAEKLADVGEVEQVRARHGAFYASLAERAAPLLLGPGQTAWADRLDVEAGNLRAARRWCGQDLARAGTGLRLAAGLGEYFHIRGHLAEGTAWLEEALTAAGGPEGARATALNGLGILVTLGGEHRRAAELFTTSIAAYQQAGDPHGQARALANLGNSLAIGGNSAEAAEAFDQALTLARRSGDRWHVAYALFLSGQGENLTGGDQAVARARVAESAELFSEVGDHRAVGYARVVLAACLLAEGQPGDALVSAREGMRAFEELPERWGLFYSAAMLAASAASIGDWPCAAMLLGVLDTLGDRTGGQLFPHLQAGLDELASQAARHLGPALSAARKAGQVIGRSDRITPALWPAVNEGGEPGAGDRLPLTRRERQIAGLIAEGLTNRQIATRLVIAERTADTHVSRILAKLGCANRAQVAAIVTATTAATMPSRPSGPGRLAAQLPTARP